MQKLNASILKMLRDPIPRLIYALVCGAAYFIIVIRFIAAYTSYAALMSLFVAPAVICGGAYFVIKLIRKALEAEGEANETSALMVFYINIWIIIIAAVFAAAFAMGIKIV